jgi:hypothetical protein
VRVHVQVIMIYEPEYFILNLRAAQKHATNDRDWIVDPVSVEQEKGPGPPCGVIGYATS